MQDKIIAVGLVFVIVLIAGVLQAVFGKHKSKKQNNLEKDGSIVVKLPSGGGFILLVMGIFMFIFVDIFVLIFLAVAPPEAHEEAGGMMMVCQGLGVLILLICIFGFYSIRSNIIAFDREKITVCKAFREDQTIRWETVGSIDMQDHLCILYDRNRGVLLRVNAQAENYARFCQAAKAQVESRGGQVKW